MKVLKIGTMKKSHLIALSLGGVILLWMLAGIVLKDPDAGQGPVSSTPEASPAPTFTVEVSAQDATPTVGYLTAQGNLMPDREVVIRAETAGRISRIVIPEGHTVSENAILANIDIGDRNIRLERAQAQVAVEQIKYNSSRKLGEEGFRSQVHIDQALALLKLAEAEEKQIRLDIANTKIKAPFDGVIDVQFVEIGDYVKLGEELFTIVDNNPLVATVSIPQQDISALKLGGKADVKLVTGEEKQGVIRFIAPRASQQTRSFRVEIEIDNPGNLPSGTSASVRIPKASVMAHFVSPALLTLNEEGVTGLKTVDDRGVVSFHPIEIVSSEKDGVYVTGLPDSAKIITNGQGFVQIGDVVTYEQ